MDFTLPIGAAFTAAKHLIDRVRLRGTLGPSAGRYGVWVKGRKYPEPQVVTITVRGGNLLDVDMDISSIGRGHAKAAVEINKRTLEGESMYRHEVPGEEPMFGTWRMRIVNSDEIDVTTRYAIYGAPEEVQGHVWRRLPG